MMRKKKAAAIPQAQPVPLATTRSKDAILMIEMANISQVDVIINDNNSIWVTVGPRTVFRAADVKHINVFDKRAGKK